MSDPSRKRDKAPPYEVQPYDQPFTSIGVSFTSPGTPPDASGVTLYETGFLRANTGWNFTGVFSPFWRLHYNWKPGHSIIHDGRQVELTPEHIFLTPHHRLIQLRGNNKVPHLWMHFNFLREMAPDVSLPFRLPVRDTELCLLRDLRDLITAHAKDEPSEAILRNSQALLNVVLARSELRWHSPPPEKLLRIKGHIEANLSQKLSCAALARLASMSEAGFNRAFKRHFSTSPARFVIEIRVREAARLLSTTAEKIESIAEQTGFPNRAYFSRIFKQVSHEAPAEFRRSHRIQ